MCGSRREVVLDRGWVWLPSFLKDAHTRGIGVMVWAVNKPRYGRMEGGRERGMFPLLKQYLLASSLHLSPSLPSFPPSLPPSLPPSFP